MIMAHHTALINKMSNIKPAATIAVVSEKDSKPLPFIVWVTLTATGSAIAGGKGLLGFKVSGLAWFIPLFFSALIIFRALEKIRFPLKLWLPWILLLALYYVKSEFTALHRTVQLMCPIVVGMAVSTCKVELDQLKNFIRLCKYFSILIVFIALFKTGLILTGKIPSVTGLAAQSMTAVLLCCLFAAGYSYGNRMDLFWWAMMAAVPIYAVTRISILSSSITLPFTLAPLSLRKRIVFIGIILFVALILFYTPRMQRKMFYSGKGELTDIFKEDSSKRSRKGIFKDDFADSGRDYMWKLMWYRIRQKPWLGHGTGSGGTFIKKITGGLAYPHNDWLLTMHDQGILGTVVFALCLILAMFHALFKAKTASGEARLLFFAGASSFIPFALIMLTDNIMVYSSYYGNLQFTILGLAYASNNNA
jgi:O-antigen ligase